MCEEGKKRRRGGGEGRVGGEGRGNREKKNASKLSFPYILDYKEDLESNCAIKKEFSGMFFKTK